MKFFTQEQLFELMQIRQFPCLTFYLPVEKEGADTRQGAIILRKMIKNAEELLKNRGVRTPNIEKLLQPVQALLDDALFWENQNIGLALFVNEQGMAMHRLPIRFTESLQVSDRYSVRPLLAMIGQDGRYALLSLGLSETRLYRCTRYSMMEIVMTPHPESLKAVFASYDVEKQLQHHSGARIGRMGATPSGTVFHGFESMKDSEKIRIQEYFRKIDQSLKESLIDEQMPVVLACVDYLAPLFRAVSKDMRLQPESISGSPDTLKRDALLQKGWEIVQPIFEKDKNKALAAVDKVMGSTKVLQDIRKILIAAQSGQVEYLFFSNGKWPSDIVEDRTGLTGPSVVESTHESEDDLLDVAAMKVMAQGGKVFVLSAGEMPVKNDCLALLRYETT